MTATDVAAAPPVAPALARAFRCLDQACIPWALLRGADELAAPVGDVDVLVAAPAAAALEALRAAGFRSVPGRGRTPHRFAHAFDPTQDRWLELDVVDEIVFGPWQQLPTGWAADVLDRRRRDGEVSRLDPSDERWLLALHQVLDKRRPVRARTSAAELSPGDRLAARLDGRCGQGTAGDVIAALAGSSQAALDALPRTLQQRWSGPVPTMLRTVRSRALRVVHDGGRWRRGDGRAVAILGPDGAGKSTLAAGLRGVDFPVDVAVVYFGLWRETDWDRRFAAVPGARFVGRVARAQRQTVRARYHRWCGRLVLLDRSPYDALIGEAADSLGGRLLGGFALAISPRPDVVLLLDAPGEVMFARKGEDTVEQLEWRRQRYLALQSQLPQLVVLDATAAEADVLSAAAAAVWRGMAAPGRRRPRPRKPVVAAPRVASRARDGAGDPLRAWRQLDWQFLLARPLPELIALGGEYDDGLVAALQDVARRRTTAEPPAELLVLVDPEPADLARQLEVCPPNTEVYVELTGVGRRSLRDWHRRARALGLRDVRVHWHVQSGGRRTRYVPLDDRASVLDTLGRHDAIRFGRLRWVVARGMLAAGLLPATLRHGSVTGLAPGSQPLGGRSALDALVWQVVARTLSAEAPAPLKPAGTVLVTPSDATSRHVVALGFAESESAPVVVAKVPRRTGDDGGIRREAELLPRLAQQAPALARAVPRVLALERLDAHDVLVTTGLDGRPLTPARVRRDVDAAVRAGLSFAAALPVTGQTDAGWYDTHVEGPITELVRSSGPALPAEIWPRTSERLERLRTAGLPAVFEHGDLSDPNLLVRRDGSLQVLDWERADEHGLPGHDLVQFLTYLADARTGAITNAHRQVAFTAAFVGPTAWARPLLTEHLRARGVAPDLRPLLILSCWARTSATLVPRVLAAHPSGTGTPGSFGAVVAAEPDVARWQLCLDRFDEL